jgi:hypothetical protein
MPIAPNIVPSETKRVAWTVEDERLLIAFVTEHKSEAGDVGNFKEAVWEAAARLLSERRTKGGVKTAESCKNKWSRVCTMFFTMPHVHRKRCPSYSTVNHVMNQSGFTWDPEQGVCIDEGSEAVWKAFVQVRGHLSLILCLADRK